MQFYKFFLSLFYKYIQLSCVVSALPLACCRHREALTALLLTQTAYKYTLHSAQYTVHSTHYTIHSTQYTVQSTLYRDE